MKIVLAGDGHSHVHEQPAAEALRALGHQVHEFRWHPLFIRGGSSGMRPLRWLLGAWGKAQNKYLAGPLFARVNDALTETVCYERADVLLVYRGTHITRKTLRAIRARSPGTVLVGYNNDDPFSPRYQWWMWRHFVSAIGQYDAVFAYRKHNVDDFTRAGARAVGLLRSWYVPSVHRPVVLAAETQARLGCDVVFVGHYERDGRLEMLERLAAAGVSVRIFGPGRGSRGYDWDGVLRSSRVLRHLAPVRAVWGDEYNQTLNAAKIALNFLSKLNRDTYTRRCFEIPASGTLLLSEYSADLASLFTEGVDADFFRSPEELVDKVKGYLSNPERRRIVAESGRLRVRRDGHDVASRMRMLIGSIESLTRAAASPRDVEQCVGS